MVFVGIARLGWATARRFVACERGATAIEYGLIAAGIAVVIVAAIFTMGVEVSANYARVAAMFK